MPLESFGVQQASALQTQALMKQQHKLIAEERSAITKEERQNMERLLITISSSIHKDLPLLFEDTLRKEFSNASTRLSAAVRASVAESLPKEIVGTSFQVPSSYLKQFVLSSSYIQDLDSFLDLRMTISGPGFCAI